MNTYNDFLTSVLQESYREHGQPKQPNPNNKVTKSRLKIMNQIKADSLTEDLEPELVALGIVEENLGTLQKYVLSKGEIPDTNPIGLSVQAATLRKNEIKHFAEVLGCSELEAEQYIEEAESKAIEINSPEADSFIGGLFGAVGSVAGRALANASAKRQKEGKKPGFSGFMAELLNPGSTSGEDLNKNGVPDNQENLNLEAQYLYEQIKAEEKRKEIKKMLPFIIIGVVVLILVVVFITKKASK